jgi:hypothetical protein
MRIARWSFGVWIVGLGLLTAAIQTTPAYAGRSCEDDTKQAIARAGAKGDADTRNTLLALSPIQVWDYTLDPEQLCTVTILDPLPSLGEPAVMSFDRTWKVEVRVTLDGKGETGYVEPDDADLLRHRFELASGGGPRTSANGARGFPNEFSRAYYGISSTALAALRDQRVHPVKWFVLSLWRDYWSIFAAVALWIGYFLVRKTGSSRRKRIREQFWLAIRNGFSQATRIGGVRWVVKGGEFHRVSLLDKEWNEAYPKPRTDRGVRRETELLSRKTRLTLAVVLPALVPAVVLLKPFDNRDAIYDDLNLILSAGVPAILILAALMVIGWELAYRQGFQPIHGAMALDFKMPQVGLREVREQKVHGDAQMASEEEALILLNPID